MVGGVGFTEGMLFVIFFRPGGCYPPSIRALYLCVCVLCMWGVALGAWAPDVFEDGPFTSQIKCFLLILNLFSKY